MNKNWVLSFSDIVLLLPVEQQHINLHAYALIMLFIPVASISMEAVLCVGVHLTL